MPRLRGRYLLHNARWHHYCKEKIKTKYDNGKRKQQVYRRGL